MSLRHWFLVAAIALVACNESMSSKARKDDSSDEEDDDGGKSKKKKGAAKKSDGEDDAAQAEVEKAKAAAAKAQAEAAKAQADAVKAQADAVKAIADAARNPPASAPGGAEPAAPTLAGRSAVPTVAEWNAKTREVTVTGSSALNCETKMVREWLRISCRGTHPGRGTAQGVRLVSGDTGKGEFFTFSSGDVASLVFPFQSGNKVIAEFRFSEGNRFFVSDWPFGAPRPIAVGRFLGLGERP
jgi:hypothetical protein